MISSLDSQYKNLSTAFKGIRFPTDDIEKSVKDQIDNLQREIVKYQEVNSELQQAQQTNEHLKSELQIEHEQQAQLGDQLKNLQQANTELQGRHAMIETELQKLKAKATEESPRHLELESEIATLRSQLEKAERDLQTTQEKLEGAEQLQQSEESSVAHWKVRQTDTY